MEEGCRNQTISVIIHSEEIRSTDNRVWFLSVLLSESKDGIYTSGTNNPYPVSGLRCSKTLDRSHFQLASYVCRNVGPAERMAEKIQLAVFWWMYFDISASLD